MFQTEFKLVLSLSYICAVQDSSLEIAGDQSLCFRSSFYTTSTPNQPLSYPTALCYKVHPFFDGIDHRYAVETAANTATTVLDGGSDMHVLNCFALMYLSTLCTIPCMPFQPRCLLCCSQLYTHVHLMEKRSMPLLEVSSSGDHYSVVSWPMCLLSMVMLKWELLTVSQLLLYCPSGVLLHHGCLCLVQTVIRPASLA